MRLTQGTFSFLTDLTDEQIAAQITYAVRNEWAIMIEHTDDPHPRNSLWEMWGEPMFDLEPERVDVAMREVDACRQANPEEYVKVVCYDRALGRQTSRLSFIVNRPADEPGFRLERQEQANRQIRYTLHPYALDRPAGRRYGADGNASAAGAASGGNGTGTGSATDGGPAGER